MTQISEMQEEITALNTQLMAVLQSENFEKLNQLLERRLGLLKHLDGVVNETALTEAEQKQYHQFLKSIAEQDQQQMLLVEKARSALQEETMRTSKGVKAVNAYHNVSKYNQR